MTLAHSSLYLRALAIGCAVLIAPGDAFLSAQEPGSQPAAASAGQETRLAPEQLDSLVAPVALYPDPLLAQLLAASTYPLEVVEARRWLQQNSSLKGQALVQAAAKQDWDASIQALVVFPTVLEQMDQSLTWTTALGNAFLAQQEDVMAAVQRMRLKAQQSGALNSNTQQKVATKSVDGQNVIVVEPANTQVIYVPSYNPVVVYGAPPVAYPYPVLSYPAYPSTGAIVAASAISFGVGVALGAAFSGCCGSGWGWGCNWGPHGAVIVNNNFFGRYGFATPYGAAGAYGRGAWAHNPYYRGGVPYSSAAVAGRYGSAAGVRTPYGRAGAVATPYGAAAGARGPNGAAGAVAGPNRAAAGVRTPNGAAGAVSTPRGNAAGVRTPYGSAVKTPNNTYSTFPKSPTPYQGSADRSAGNGKWGSWGGSKPAFDSGSRSAFSGAERGQGGWARSSSNRGFSSMGGRGGGRGRR
jgi:hypothetical protein